MKFDETDVTILRRLQRDARANFSEVAKECGVSVDTIIKRFQRLQKKGVVRGTTVLIDPRRLNYGCMASLELSVDMPCVNDVVSQVGEQQGVVFCTPSMGRNNVFAVAVLGNMNDLNALLEKVKHLRNVGEVKTSIWVDDLLLCPENFELEGMRGVTA